VRVERDPRRLVPDHVAGTLTPAERRAIMRAALDDQALFDALLDAEPLRQALDDAAARQRLLDLLSRPTRWERARSWLRRQATFRDLALVAAAVSVLAAGVWILHRPAPSVAPPQRVAAPGAGTTELTQRLFGLLPQTPIPARVEPEAHGTLPAEVSPGAPLRLAITLDRDSWLLVLERAETGGSIARWFPAGGRLAQRVDAHARTAIRQPDGGPWRAPTTPGAFTVRFVALPARIDPATLQPDDVPGLVPQITIVDRAFAVEETRP